METQARPSCHDTDACSPAVQLAITISPTDGPHRGHQPRASTWFDEELLQLELAEREYPRCQRCGEHTVVSPREDGSLWLQCASLGNHKRAFTRLLGVHITGGHTCRMVIPAPAPSGAA